MAADCATLRLDVTHWSGQVSICGKFWYDARRFRLLRAGGIRGNGDKVSHDLMD
jgi:hypothetical protein